MRSRREEYAKRFEETTKQEIKNYNDSLLNTHIALEEFRGKLKDSVDQYTNQVAQLASQIKKLEVENDGLKSHIATLDQRLERQVHDFNNLEKSKLEDDRKSADFYKWIKEELNRQDSHVYKMRETIRDEAIMSTKRIEDIFQEVGHCYRKSKADNDNLKSEILSIPSEAKQVKNELLAKAAESAIDSEGIRREIDIVKKKSVIQESLNEYFHIQLDRLKDRNEK